MSSTELAVVRNRLFNGKYDERDRQVLRDALCQAEARGTAIDRLVAEASAAAMAAAEAGDLSGAAHEVNLIHNVPLSPGENWNQNHFLEFELPTYFDQDVSVSRIRAVVLAVADAVRSLEAD